MICRSKKTIKTKSFEAEPIKITQTYARNYVVLCSAVTFVGGARVHIAYRERDFNSFDFRASAEFTPLPGVPRCCKSIHDLVKCFAISQRIKKEFQVQAKVYEHVGFTFGWNPIYLDKVHNFVSLDESKENRDALWKSYTESLSSKADECALHPFIGLDVWPRFRHLSSKRNGSSKK